MKRIALSIAIASMFAVSVFAQSNRATRPRVAPTPTPEVIDKSETVIRSDSRSAPVLQGNRSTGRPEPSATPPGDGEDDDVIRVETNLVTMPVSVLDRNGRFVSGLQQRDFKIFENGVEQEVGFFQSVEQPFTVVLMIDVSPSTAYQIDQIHNSAIAFIDQLRPNDRVMVIAFDERVHILSRATNDRNALRNAIRRAQIGSGTSLYTAVAQVLERELKQVQGRKAIVLFTDGVDTTSRRASYDSTVREAEETDVLIYPIRYDTLRDYGVQHGGAGGARFPPSGGRGGLGDILGIILGGGNVTLGGQRGGGAGTSPAEYALGRKYLETLALNSGGRHFEAESIYNLEAAFSGIAEELRRQYSLGYYPENAGQVGERKRISVRVMRPNLVVRAKTTYVVGENNNSRFAGN